MLPLPQNPIFFQCQKLLSLQIYPLRYLKSFKKHKFTVFCDIFRQYFLKNLVKRNGLTKKLGLRLGNY